MKVDVAVQSYKKPESLIYTLLTLHRFCKDSIDTVWIDDDCSGDECISKYLSEKVLSALNPWIIKVRVNSKPAGVRFTTIGILLHSPLDLLLYVIKLVFKEKREVIVQEDDIRYQWAINNTDKDYLMLIHDDVKFTGDVLNEGGYLESALKPNIAIVGDLGQCWRCVDEGNCNPKKILNHSYPSKIWPVSNTMKLRHRHVCRINEWCCLINVDIARHMAKKKIYFGSFQGLKCDTAVYWFDKIIKAGYGFDDPLALKDKFDFFIHAWSGFAGHSSWVDQGDGIHKYDFEIVKQRIYDEFGLNVIDFNNFSQYNTHA